MEQLRIEPNEEEFKEDLKTAFKGCKCFLEGDEKVLHFAEPITEVERMMLDHFEAKRAGDGM